MCVLTKNLLICALSDNAQTKSSLELLHYTSDKLHS